MEFPPIDIGLLCCKTFLAMFLLSGVSVAVCEILIILLAFIFIDLSFIIDKQNGTPTTTPATAVF